MLNRRTFTRAAGRRRPAGRPRPARPGRPHPAAGPVRALHRAGRPAGHPVPPGRQALPRPAQRAGRRATRMLEIHQAGRRLRARSLRGEHPQADRDDVFALFGYIGTPTSLAACRWPPKDKVPFFAPFTGAMALRQPFNRYAFHVRASYNDETALIVKQLTHAGPEEDRGVLPERRLRQGRPRRRGRWRWPRKAEAGGAGHGGAQLGDVARR
jgi:branched-chain amino acid transport system substrate-binding protein